MASLMGKARKPKFDVHLKISDLNNVPLVSGVSLVKWHLPHSIHGEHRGRTQKCPIVNHRVEYNYAKVVPVRIAIDRSNVLAECPIEFEVLQEFSAPANAAGGGGGRDERITLGTVRLNLSEYVEESEAILRDSAMAAAIKEALASPVSRVEKPRHHRKRSSLSNVVSIAPDASPPRSSHEEEDEQQQQQQQQQQPERPVTPVTPAPSSSSAAAAATADIQDGVVRRYLMQDSKINSTLKISILMVQVDGERSYVAPPPKSAPMFGGIAEFVAGDAFDPADAAATTPGLPPSSFTAKSRDVFELQDMYRRALAASWASLPAELPADQVIEDIFAGGDGFKTSSSSSSSSSSSLSPSSSPLPKSHHRRGHSRHHHHHHHDGEEHVDDTTGTLRPRDMTRQHQHQHMRGLSAASDRSVATVLQQDSDRDRDRDRDREPFPPLPHNLNLNHNYSHSHSHSHSYHHHHRRNDSRLTVAAAAAAAAAADGPRSRSASLASLATTVGSDGERGRDGFRRAREVDEFEVREDLVAWTIPGSTCHHLP